MCLNPQIKSIQICSCVTQERLKCEYCNRAVLTLLMRCNKTLHKQKIWIPKMTRKYQEQITRSKQQYSMECTESNMTSELAMTRFAQWRYLKKLGINKVIRKRTCNWYFPTVRVLTCLKALFDSFWTRRVDAHKVKLLGNNKKPHPISTDVHSAYMQTESTHQDTANYFFTQRTERTTFPVKLKWSTNSLWTKNREIKYTQLSGMVRVAHLGIID